MRKRTPSAVSNVAADALASAIADIRDHRYGRAVERLSPLIDKGADRVGADLLNAYSLALAGAGRLPEAIDTARRLLAVAPPRAEIRVNLANLLLRARRPEEARAFYGEALQAQPNLPAAWLGMGNCHAAEGEIEAAIAAYHRVLEASPAHAGAFHRLAMMGKGGQAPAEPALVRRFAARLTAAPPAEAMLIESALGHLADQAGRTDAAFAHIDRANRLAREQADRRGRRWSPAAEWRRLERLAQEARRLVRRPPPPRSAPLPVRPILIVGMPRSGTTLLEQQLCRHPAVWTADELSVLLDHVAPPRDAAAVPPGGAALARLGPTYVEALTYFSRVPPDPVARPFVIDKNPLNFLSVPWFKALFPDGVVLYCRRTWQDVCLSCYFQSFQEALGFASDLSSIVECYKIHLTAIALWSRLLPNAIETVDYAALVADPAGVLDGIWRRLGLAAPPAEAVADPRKTVVQTASQVQVRRPVAAAATPRWHAYRAHLAPILAEDLDRYEPPDLLAAQPGRGRARGRRR